MAAKLPWEWTNEHLQADFDTFNKTYFRGELSALYVEFRSLDKVLGWTKRYRTHKHRRHSSDRFGIQIAESTRFSRTLWRSTLLHEMVHLKQRCRYSCGRGGTHFHQEMTRLALAGAFRGVW